MRYTLQRLAPTAAPYKHVKQGMYYDLIKDIDEGNLISIRKIRFTSESVRESPYNEGMGILPGGTIKYTLEIITDTEN